MVHAPLTKCLLILLLVLGLTSMLSASPVLLASFSYNVGWGILSGYIDHLQGDPKNLIVTWGICPAANCNHDEFTLLAQPQLFTLTIPPSSISQTFQTQQFQDSNFQAFASALASHNSSMFFLGFNFDTLKWPPYEPDPWYGILGESFYAGCQSALCSPATKIDSFVLTLSPFWIYYGTNFNFTGWWMVGSPPGRPDDEIKNIYSTIDVFGTLTTPEPGSFLLFVSGFVSLGGILRRNS